MSNDVLGLAVVLSLTVSVTTALASMGVGAVFNLGQLNTVGAISTLVGSVSGSSLQIDNNSTGKGSRAQALCTGSRQHFSKKADLLTG